MPDTTKIHLVLFAAIITFGYSIVTAQATNSVLDLASGDLVDTCEMHSIPLKTTTVPVIYGPNIYQESPAYQSAKIELFPHSDDAIYLSGTGTYKTARVKTCYKCQSAFRVWVKQQNWKAIEAEMIRTAEEREKQLKEEPPPVTVYEEIK